MSRICLLIDTDPGVDDALAILMGCANADVVGLSVAAGNVGLAHTVSNALKLVEVIGANVSVFAGCATPLVLPAEDAAFVHGMDGFGDTGYAKALQSAQSEHAAQAILRLSHANAGRLVLVAIAPLTNLALALRLDPTLPQRIARLVIMGGAVTGKGNIDRVPTEFNIGFDPEAAHIVFSSWPKFELVDWELTLRHGIAFEQMAKWLSGSDPRAKFYASIARKTHEWTRTRGRPKVMVADALAMAVALRPDIVLRAEEHHVAVELNGTITRGATIVDWQDRSGIAANARIVLDIDQDRFESLVASAFGGG